MFLVLLPAAVEKIKDFGEHEVYHTTVVGIDLMASQG